MSANIFISGGTGYIGRALIPRLLARGHAVRAMVREGAQKKLPPGDVVPIKGDPLQAETFAAHVRPSDTFIHLVGVPHPSPAKAAQFRAIDLVSIQAAVAAAQAAGVSHFIYLSVAQPAPVMKVYQEVRAEGERLLRTAGLKASFIRPWYVLGPGHRWPYALLPAYWLLEKIPVTRDSAIRLGLVTLEQMIATLVWAVENPTTDIRILDVPAIRSAARSE